jgi:TolB-like protein/DNA-binding winged helix-turn-helix (wHTH) protein
MPPLPRIRFGRFEYDGTTGELWQDGNRVPLQPQPSRLLGMLLARPGELVPREEIRAALWGDDIHVDFDRSLNFCVARLRSALGDDAADPRFIETLPTRGYRWLPAADIADNAERKTAADYADDAKRKPAADYPEDAEATPSRSRAALVASAFRRKVTTPWLVAGAAVAIAAVVALRVLWPIDGPKVVVVPFHNETGSPDLDRVAKDVSDATVVRLVELDRLRVIGNASGLQFSFRPRDMKAMGESLGAQYLVLGQMKRDDRRMWIVAHLIRVSDQTHVWANTYDTDLLDLPQQAAIARQIAAAVSVRIGKS